MSLSQIIFCFAPIVLVSSLPKCQYAQIENSFAFFPMDSCMQTFNGSETYDLKYACNSTNNGINVLIYPPTNGVTCSGNAIYSVDETPLFTAFDCSLPVCNDNDDALVKATIYETNDNCNVSNTTPYNTIQLITNQCGKETNETTAELLTCDIHPFTITYHQYENLPSCQGDFNVMASDTINNGCTNNVEYMEILKCTKPIHVSDVTIVDTINKKKTFKNRLPLAINSKSFY